MGASSKPSLLALMAVLAVSRPVWASPSDKPSPRSRGAAPNTRVAGSKTMVKLSPEITALLERLDSERIDTKTTMQLGQRPHAVDELLAFVRTKPTGTPEEQQRTVERQRKVVPILVDLGRVRVPPQGPFPERFGPIVTDPRVVRFLVEGLASPDATIRHLAFLRSIELVPASLLAPHSQAIRAAIESFPAEDGAILLLGKTADHVAALALLKRAPELEASNQDNAIMVRARLGDPKAEEALLRAYRDTDKAVERGALALRLGYAATPKMVALLAQEVRSPQYYVWNKLSRRSLRVHVISGLHLVFPTESVFWEPVLTPENDSYYAGIEAWLAKNLGTTWSTPRPEFLYEEAAPTGR